MTNDSSKSGKLGIAVIIIGIITILNTIGLIVLFCGSGHQPMHGMMDGDMSQFEQMMDGEKPDMNMGGNR